MPNHRPVRTWVLVLAACALLLGACRRADPPAPTRYFDLGVEDWQLGPGDYVVRVAPGPVAVTAIDGSVTAGPLPGSDPTAGYVRQTLVSITYPGAGAPPGVSLAQLPSFPRKEASVSLDLWDQNVKETGAGIVVAPVRVSFPSPVTLPGGKLLVHFDNQTYQVGGNVTAAVECLDVELHAVVFYTST